MFCSILPFAVLTLSSWSAWCYLGPMVCILCLLSTGQMNAKQALSHSRRDDLQGFSQCWCWCGSPRCSLRLRSACWAVSTVDWQECLAMQSVLVVVFPHASSDSKDFTFVLVKAHTCTLSSFTAHTARLLRSFWLLRSSAAEMGHLTDSVICKQSQCGVCMLWQVVYHFMYRTNNAGLRTLPWGTSESIGKKLDLVPSTTTACCQFLRKLLNHVFVLPVIL